MNDNREHEDLQLQQRLERLRYPVSQQDMWPTVRDRIQPVVNAGRLVPAAVLIIAWRALQLMFDLPFPLLHPLVPFAAAAWALWPVADSLLAIETSAPELEKRGI